MSLNTRTLLAGLGLALSTGFMVQAQELRERFDGDASTCLRSSLEKMPSASIGAYGSERNGVRIRYMGTNQGSERSVFQCPLPVKRLDATLSYDVRFEDDFQFVKGGKLHGLGPDRVMSGGDGKAPDGWSARVVFRKEGGIETYVYNQGQAGDFGQIFRAKDFRFEPGRYYRVTLYVKVNSGAQASDGVVRLFVDGQKLVERTDLRYRAVDGDRGLISRVLFSTFHGGGAPDWAPKDRSGQFTAVFADFDNFRVIPGEPDAEALQPAPSVQKQR